MGSELQAVTGAGSEIDEAWVDVTLRARIAEATLTGISYRPPRSEEPIVVPERNWRRISFEEASPIRQPMAYQGQRSKPGYYLMARTGQLTSYESKFEAAHLMLRDRDHHLASVISQPFRLHWRDQSNRPRSHVPDFLLQRADGTGEVMDVKGSRRAALPDNALVFGVTRRACAQLGFSFTVAQDIPPVVRANHRWLAGYRFATDRVAELGPFVLNAAEWGMALNELWADVSQRASCPVARMKAVTFHLLWAGLLHCDFTTPLSGTTVIYTPART